jgi:hypothetical protein
MSLEKGKNTARRAILMMFLRKGETNKDNEVLNKIGS